MPAIIKYGSGAPAHFTMPTGTDGWSAAGAVTLTAPTTKAANNETILQNNSDVVGTNVYLYVKINAAAAAAASTLAYDLVLRPGATIRIVGTRVQTMSVYADAACNYNDGTTAKEFTAIVL